MSTMFSTEKLREWMRKKDLTQQELSEMINVHRVTVGRWLTDAAPIPSHRQLQLLALMNGVQVDGVTFTQVKAVAVRFTPDEWAEVVDAGGESHEEVELFLRKAVLEVCAASKQLVDEHLQHLPPEG